MRPKRRLTEWDKYYRRRRWENIVAVSKLTFFGMLVLLYVVLNIIES